MFSHDYFLARKISMVNDLHSLPFRNVLEVTVPTSLAVGSRFVPRPDHTKYHHKMVHT